MYDLLKAVQALIESVADDNNRHGGLLSRATTRKTDECRVLVNRMLSDLEQAKAKEKPP